MNILQVSAFDIAGGAEKVAWGLLDAYRTRGHAAWLAVGAKRSVDPDVLQIPRRGPPGPIERRLRRLAISIERQEQSWPGLKPARQALNLMVGGLSAYDYHVGREDFNYPGSRQLLQLPPKSPQIVHAHNLHIGYFDLRYLSELSQHVPLVLTLHDEWLLTGHCAYTLGCPRWQRGCGQCPDLTIYPEVKRDATDWNWKRKSRIFRKSKLYVATPSRWLYDRVQRSMLAPAESRIIPYGVDHTIFRSAQRASVREALGLPAESLIVLFVAYFGKKNRSKDFVTLEAAMTGLNARATSKRPVVLIALGGADGDEQLDQVQVKNVGFEPDARKVAQYYQAADVYVHSAHTDNFPNSILEAMACGLPVVATAVGGIPEQIIEGETGFLTPPHDAVTMAARVNQLLTDDALREVMGRRASEDSLQRFDMNRQADAYLAWYAALLEQRNRATHGR